MNKYLREIHDSSQSAAEIGAKIIAILADMQKELLQLSEDIKSLHPSASVEATLAAQGAGLLDNEAPVDSKAAEIQKVMDNKAKQATTEVDIAASHTIRK